MGNTDKLKSFLRNVELVNGYRDYEGGPCTNRINLAPLMQSKLLRIRELQRTTTRCTVSASIEYETREVVRKYVGQICVLADVKGGAVFVLSDG